MPKRGSCSSPRLRQSPCPKSSASSSAVPKAAPWRAEGVEIPDPAKWWGKKPKSPGSVGIHVIVTNDKGELPILVHRRSKSVGHPREVAVPGGMIDRRDLEKPNIPFEEAARGAARRGLWEESGLDLNPDAMVLLPALSQRG